MQTRVLIHTLVLVISILALTTACSDPDGPSRSDPDGHISYRLIGDWEAVPGSSETRFKPVSNNRVEMQINTVAKSRGGLARQRDVWLDAQRRSGAEVFYSEDWQTPHFQGVAYGHSAEGMMGPFHWHHIVLEGENFVIASHLQVPPDAPDDWLSTYRDIVASIQPAAP